MSNVTISVDVMKVRADLNDLQRKKLEVAAKILKRTAALYCGNKSLLPLWAAGVVTHGQPKSKNYVIGCTLEAKDANIKETSLDHLFRVTATAEHILKNAAKLTEEEIEEILLHRAITMRTTQTENNNNLKKAIKECTEKDNWQELYRAAKIEYEMQSTKWVDVKEDPARTEQ
ncbi:MAG: hypothetical protein H7831_18320 [Magnetococcus sp. WYHC-3]